MPRGGTEHPDPHHATQEYPTALAFSNDGRWCALGDAGGEVAIVDAVEGRTIARHRADCAEVVALAWQPGTRRLAVGGQSGVLALYGEAGLEVEVPLDSPWIERIARQPEGRGLVAVQGCSVVQVDADGRRIASSTPQASTLTKLAYWARLPRAGGRQIVTCCYGNERIVAAGCQDNTVHFWRFADGRDSPMAGYPLKPKSLAFSADCRWLATSGGPSAIVWPFDGCGPKGRDPLMLPEHPAPVEVVAFARRSPGLVSRRRAGDVRLWVPGVRPEPLAIRRLGHAVPGNAWGLDGRTNASRLPTQGAPCAAAYYRGRWARGSAAAWARPTSHVRWHRRGLPFRTRPAA